MNLRHKHLCQESDQLGCVCHIRRGGEVMRVCGVRVCVGVCVCVCVCQYNDISDQYSSICFSNQCRFRTPTTQQ